MLPRECRKNRQKRRPWDRSAVPMALACALLIIFPGICLANSPGNTEMHAGAVGPEDETIQYLKNLSLEELAGLEVTSVSKKPVKLSDAPAAVFVITNEDIRRSGVTSIPEALRLAPGVQVARINSNSWAITSRGFNGYFANKLLVMIDGRTVYSPLYSGVYWNVQDVLLEDIDRIEVIRGPGASLWGANAVNGVINVITKSANDAPGGLVTAGAGTYERGFAGVRCGTRIGEAGFRAYAKFFDRDVGADSAGLEANDGWRMFRGGFRADARISDRNSLTLQGAAYGGRAGVTYAFPSVSAPYKDVVRENTDLGGGNLLARWKHTFPNPKAGGLALQIYYDHTKNEDSLVDEVRDTLDMDFQHGFTIGRHEIMWGMEYRWTSDHLGDGQSTSFNPSERTLDLFSVFIQDQMTLLEKRLWLILGAKFENGYYTEWEAQPTGRLLWKPLEAHTLWAAVSRAVRTPSRAEKDIRMDAEVLPPGSPANPSPLPVMLRFLGDEDFASEELIAYEVGWRLQTSERFFCDLSVFYNDYNDIFSRQSPGPAFTPGPPPHLIAPVTFTNERDVQSRGLELAATLAPLDWTRLQFAYSYLRVDEDANVLDIEGYSPEHQFSLLASMDLPYNLELDLWARYVDDLPTLDVGDHVTLDIRLGWRPSGNLEFSLVGRDLMDAEHPEYQDLFSALTSTEVERSIYAKAVWRF